MKNDDYLSKLNDEIIERIDSTEELMAITGGSNTICVNYGVCVTVNPKNCEGCEENKDCFTCLDQTDCSCKDKECVIYDFTINYVYSQCSVINGFVGCQ